MILKLEEEGVHFKSLTDGIDTSTPSGKFSFHIMASLAQMERELIVERTKAGLKADKSQGQGRGQEAETHS
jgi:DNA invertase Pin-like site-specific DNA recombinase